MDRHELQRLIEVIADELAAASGPASRCACHGVAADLCPDRLASAVAWSASRPGVHAGSKAPGEIAPVIDHTLLKPEATAPAIDTLCQEAARFGFATVCVNPIWVARCARSLAGSRVGVCSVVGFPFGATTPDVKAYETRRAVFDGAREIDMVINVGALKSGDLRLVERDVEAVVAASRDGGALVKVIIEAALLSDEEKIAACSIAKAAGAAYVKTSTGFGPGGATAADVALMRRVVGAEMGVKAAGGIRSLGEAREMLAAGASRIGTSASVRIVQAIATGRRVERATGIEPV